MKDSIEDIADAIGTEDAGQKLIAVYLFDETEILTYKQMVNDQKMVAGLIYLDNYDEALESVEEVRRSLLTALIDRKITKYITAMKMCIRDSMMTTELKEAWSGNQEMDTVCNTIAEKMDQMLADE